jgi:two-component system CheB/CheR fusion protein
MLEPGQSPEEQRELIDMIRSGYQRLEGFIQAGLDYFEWLGAKRQDATEPVDVLDVLRAELARVEGGAPPRNVEISAPESSCWVPWNAELLAEVVRVLLENAVKFSEASQRIRVEVEASEGTVTLKVIDRGTGFEPEMGDELLRPLTIGNVMKHSQGTGLSLAKVSHMVTAHGGVMKAESPGLGLGATFSVTIPVECQDEAA